MNTWGWLTIIVLVALYVDSLRRGRTLRRAAREMLIAHSRMVTDNYQSMRNYLIKLGNKSRLDWLNNKIIDEAKLRDEMNRKL